MPAGRYRTATFKRAGAGGGAAAQVSGVWVDPGVQGSGGAGVRLLGGALRRFTPSFSPL